MVLGPRLGHIPPPLKLFGEDKEGVKLLLKLGMPDVLAPKSFYKLLNDIRCVWIEIFHGYDID